MSITSEQRNSIKSLLIEKITHKLESYKPETNNMPFHVRLLGADRMAIFSFVHSINTLLGTSIFEQVSEILAIPHFLEVEMQSSKLSNAICEASLYKIQDLMNELKSGNRAPDKIAEISILNNIVKEGKELKLRQPIVDLYLKSSDGYEYYIDLKTAKPNIGAFVEYKRTLLEWVAFRQHHCETLKIKTLLAIPYNPYSPKPYERWTMRGLFDLKEELLVETDYWDFLSGQGTFEELLNVFFEAGQYLRSFIDQRFELLR